MAHLTTVPSFIFWQVNEDGYDSERAIQVCYHNGSIRLNQGEHSIFICLENLEELFREIVKHQPEAEEWLKK